MGVLPLLKACKNKLRLVMSVLLLILSHSLYAVTYSVSPSGWTSKPSSSITYNGVTYIDATTQGIYIRAKAVVNSDNTITFYVKKSSGSFQNTTQFRLIKDINGSNQKAVGQEYAYSGDTEASITITPDFSSGSYKYTFLVVSNGTSVIRFCTSPITITANSGSPSLSLASSQSFGTTTLTAGTTYTYTVKVKNTGTADWSGHLYLKSGSTDWIPFYDRTIPAGGTVTLSKTYTPTTTGSHTLTLYYQTGGSGDGVKVPAGSYSNPFTVTVVGASPSLSLASSQSFGTTTLTAGTTYTYTVKVKNTGSADWSGHLFLKSGSTDWIPFYDRTISAGSTVTLTKTYTPTTTGTHTLTLYYQTGGSGDGVKVPAGSYSNPFTVTVVGASASLSLASSQSFGTTTLNVGTAYTYTVKVKNSGTADWNGNLYLKSGDTDWIRMYDRTIKAGGTLTLNDKTYTPKTTDVGSHTLTLYYQPKGGGDGVKVPAGSYKNPFTVTVVSGTSPSVDCPFPDCPGGEVCEASTYLYKLGILEGINGKLMPDDNVTRAQLAKLSLYGLYGGPSKVPSTLVSDKFPSIYPDLQNTSAYYYRSAKALLYLEYQDGVSPFDRNRSFFNPENNIERNLVLKVICETFNIKPETNTSNNPFSDFSPSQVAWGYAKKCYDLGIAKLVNTTKFRPFDFCKRKEAILYLYRTLTSSNVTIPTPSNTYTLSSSSFFIPANLSANTMGVMKGIEAGNFNFYEKDFFNIDGYMPLNFGVTYNSCLTELPSDFYPVAPLGTAWSHTYNIYMTIINDANSNNKTIVFHNADGSMFLYNYDDLSSLTDGNYFTVARSTASRYTLTSPSGTVYTYNRSYAADNIYYLTSIKDRNGNTLTITYEDGVTKTPANTYARRVKTVSTLGRSLTFSYASGTDLLKTVTDPSNRQVTFNFSNNILTSLKDAKGQTTSFTYGTSDKETGLLKSIKLPRGNVINNGYQQRKLTSTKYNSDTPTKVTITANYTSGTTSTKVVQPVTGNQSITTTIKLDNSGRVKSATDNDKTDVSMTYGDSNNPTLPTKIVDNKTGISTSFTYNKKGKVTKSVITAGSSSITEKYTYNSYNDITSYTDAKGNVTKYGYTNGNLSSVTDAMGHITNITNNSYGVPTEVTDPMGRTVTMQYNSYGNVTKVNQTALSLSTSFGYDNISRITSTTNQNGKKTTYSYDKNDNVVSVTDPLSHVTKFTFDANDNLTKITNAKGGETSLTYDDDDLLTGQSFQGYTKSFTYNIDGSLSSSTSANGNTRNYSYDDSGYIIDDGYASYSYNSKGWLSSVKKDGKTLSFGYDGFNRITSTSCDGHSNSYSYDDNGNCTSINGTTYGYDKLNRLTTVTFSGKTITYTYHKDSQLSKVSYPNGMTTEYGYDAVGRLTSKKTKLSSGTVIASYNYTLDKVGNIISQTIKEPYGDMKLANEDVSYSYNSGNRITKAGDISFSFDANGNTTKRGSESYSWDKSDHLVRAGSTSMEYDPLGLIVSYGDVEFTTNPLGIGSVLSDSKSGAAYIYGNGLEARVKNGKVSYYVTDFRGSVVAIVDDNGKITHKYQYDEYGKVTQKQEADYNPFQYVGKYGVMALNDHQYYMRARHYDPTIGRFLSEDPIWSTNLYPYADNNPITNVDISGGSPLLAGAVIGGIEGLINGLPDTAESCVWAYYGFKSLFNNEIALADYYFSEASSLVWEGNKSILNGIAVGAVTSESKVVGTAIDHAGIVYTSIVKDNPDDIEGGITDAVLNIGSQVITSKISNISTKKILPTRKPNGQFMKRAEVLKNITLKSSLASSLNVASKQIKNYIKKMIKKILPW